MLATTTRASSRHRLSPRLSAYTQVARSGLRLLLSRYPVFVTIILHNPRLTTKAIWRESSQGRLRSFAPPSSWTWTVWYCKTVDYIPRVLDLLYRWLVNAWPPRTCWRANTSEIEHQVRP